MSDIVEAPSVGHQHDISLAVLAAGPVPKSGIPPSLTFVKLGCHREVNMDLPDKPGKDIPCGENGAEWVAPGRSVPGTLELTSLDFHELQTDILAYRNKRLVAKIESRNEAGDIVRTMYAVNWRPTMRFTGPDGDEESRITASGRYQYLHLTPEHEP